MKIVLTSILSMVLVISIGSAYAETTIGELDTDIYGIYRIDVELKGIGQYELWWNEKIKMGQVSTNEYYSVVGGEVTTDKIKTKLKIISDTVTIFDVKLEKRGQSSPEQIESNFSSAPQEDTKDKRIAELEERVKLLENEKTELEKVNNELEKINHELQKQIDNLQQQLENANVIVQAQLKVMVDTLKNFKLG